mmetsp:Transcript_42080/g.85921  ORF Transcript_42080/g.85921 Transcript_42080/m.85921 type:complete len:799 (-) Transcript_42080:69-2465(-)|eukprot:CAMPEP_0181342216 /NCGR_PEP_ID=MMETSP1101-20121128/30870_1 /TAXON_ID=46948 /ORGANISM="Rhodomonas abbreviata, Strain Caron Lab Isolate" /LENGTH=798 /DNA_ID=CAMNT_0023453635 /DNA_START=240 /DNA_END=2636 /DNA_ORIENTATION=-
MVNFEEVLKQQKEELGHWLSDQVFIDYAGMKSLIDESVTRQSEIEDRANQAPEDAENTMSTTYQGSDFFEAWNLELQKVKAAIERLLDGKRYCSVPCGPLLLTLSTEQMSREHSDALFKAIELNREGFRKIIKKWDKHHCDKPPAQDSRVATFDIVMAGTMDRLEDIVMFDNRARGSKSQKAKIFSLFFLVAVIAIITLVSMQATAIQVAFATGLIASFLTAWGNAANDICNSVGTAVGCKALTLGQAVMWGAVFEVIGALTMGPYVSKSITKGIIITDDYEATPDMYAFGMVCVLFGTGSTTLLATFYGFPISATHGMIGGLVVIGLATKGWSSIGWSVIIKTCIGWVAAPLVGCIVGALIFLLISTFMRPGCNAALWSARLQPFWLWLCLSVNIVFIFIKGPKKLKIEPTGKAVGFGSLLGLAAVAVIFLVVWLKSQYCKGKVPDTSEEGSGVNADSIEAGEGCDSGAGVGEGVCREDAQRRVSAESKESGEVSRDSREGKEAERGHGALDTLKEMVQGKGFHKKEEKPTLRFTFRKYSATDGGVSVEAEKVKHWVAHPTGEELREHLEAVKHVGEHVHELHGPASEEADTDIARASSEEVSVDVHPETGAPREVEGGDDAGEMAQAEKRFVPLLIVSAFSVACAHGGNDVGNAIGPLSAILQVVEKNEVSSSPDIPFWALVFGSAGFLIGIVTMGRLTIQTVGNKITELTPSKSFATQMGGAIAVLSSSALGLPVSTSHCLVGAVVGIGVVQKCMATGSVNMVVLGRIAVAWVVTIPLAMLVSVSLYLPLKHLFD